MDRCVYCLESASILKLPLFSVKICCFVLQTGSLGAVGVTLVWCCANISSPETSLHSGMQYKIMYMSLRVTVG